jgi:hypothetical protein
LTVIGPSGKISFVAGFSYVAEMLRMSSGEPGELKEFSERVINSGRVIEWHQAFKA